MEGKGNTQKFLKKMPKLQIGHTGSLPPAPCGRSKMAANGVFDSVASDDSTSVFITVFLFFLSVDDGCSATKCCDVVDVVTFFVDITKFVVIILEFV